MTTNKNFELFHEYQKRIVEELLEEYSSKGITLYIEVTKKVYYNQYNDAIGTYYCKYHRPKLDYNKFAGEVKAAFKRAFNMYFDMVKRVKEQKIEGKLRELEKDFEQ